MNSKNYIDTDFLEISKDNKKIKYINKPKYYSIGEVATKIGVPSSTIDFWSIKFNDVLKVERPKIHRKYTQYNITQLLKIKVLLKEQNYSIKQALIEMKKIEEAKEYLENSQIDNASSNNVSAIIANEVERQLSTYKDNTMSILKNEFIDIIIPKLQNVMVSTVNSALSEKLDIVNSTIQNQNKLQLQNKDELKKYINDTIKDCVANIKSTLDDKEVNADKKDLELTELLKKILQERKEEYEKNKKQSLFTRIFHKDKS